MDRTTQPADLSEVLTRTHLPALDGLRAVAVGVVVAYHGGLPVPGDLGVTGFFVLSGFLITWLLRKELARTGTVSLRDFYLRRTFRIFPAYYALVAFSLVVDNVLTHNAWTRGEAAATLGYFVNYFHAFRGVHESPIAHAWSLAVEEQFYLLWPLAFLALAARGERALRTGLAATIAAVVAWRSALYLGAGVGEVYVYNAFDTRADCLAVGCLLAVLAGSPRVRGWLSALARTWWAPLPPLVLLAVSRSATPDAYHYSLGFTVDTLLIALLITQLLHLHPSRAWRWLDHPATRYLGRISYPAYLWHMVAFAVAHRLPVAAAGQFAAAVALTVALATGSYFIVERPALALRPRLTERLRAFRRVPAARPSLPL